MRNDLEALHPAFRRRVEKVLAALTEAGYQPQISSGWRSRAEQERLVKMGRSKVSFSFHNATAPDGSPAALAVDITDKRWGWGGECASLDAPFWRALGEQARLHRLTWGNDWDGDGIEVGPDPDESFADVAHVQLLPNRDLKRVRDGWLPPVDDEGPAAPSVPAPPLTTPPAAAETVTHIAAAAAWRLIQHGLQDLGLDVGPIDGAPGPRTRLAMQRALEKARNT